ncbi:hypothetical protein [Sphingobium ummariense]
MEEKDINISGDLKNTSRLVMNRGGFNRKGNVDVLIEGWNGVKNKPGLMAGVTCDLNYGDELVVVEGLVSGVGGDVLRIEFPIKDRMRPLQSARINVPEGVTVDPGLRTFLGNIFPLNDEIFERTFIRSVQRYGGQENQYFTAKQISMFFAGKRAYRASAAVVMAYKSVEMNDEELQMEAWNEIEEHIARIEECEISWHPRLNREHLLVSLLCAKWHIALSLGREEDFRDLLHMSAKLINGLSNYFTLAYNLSISLLMQGLVMRRDGNDEAVAQIQRASFELFQAAVRDAQATRTLFKELEVSHTNAIFLMDVLATPEPTDVNYDAWLRAALRVRGESLVRLSAIFKNLSSPR